MILSNRNLIPFIVKYFFNVKQCVDIVLISKYIPASLAINFYALNFWSIRKGITIIDISFQMASCVHESKLL